MRQNILGRAVLVIEKRINQVLHQGAFHRLENSFGRQFFPRIHHELPLVDGRGGEGREMVVVVEVVYKEEMVMVG